MKRDPIRQADLETSWWPPGACSLNCDGRGDVPEYRDQIAVARANSVKRLHQLVANGFLKDFGATSVE